METTPKSPPVNEALLNMMGINPSILSIHLATVLLRPPSGHRPRRRQARHARVLQIGLRLAIAKADAIAVMPISFR